MVVQFLSGQRRIHKDLGPFGVLGFPGIQACRMRHGLFVDQHEILGPDHAAHLVHIQEIPFEYTAHIEAIHKGKLDQIMGFRVVGGIFRIQEGLALQAFGISIAPL